MELWDRDVLDLVKPGSIEIGKEGRGSLGFIAVEAWLDWRGAERDGRPVAEFSFEGNDEGDPVSGRGWAALQDDGCLVGHIWFHHGDDSGFRAVPGSTEPERRAR
jgi:hypothetical protein